MIIGLSMFLALLIVLIYTNERTHSIGRRFFLWAIYSFVLFVLFFIFVGVAASLNMDQWELVSQTEQELVSINGTCVFIDNSRIHIMTEDGKLRQITGIMNPRDFSCSVITSEYKVSTKAWTTIIPIVVDHRTTYEFIPDRNY